ncbi:hypothetical protein OG756_29755 [Streptomyces sp. NBC_01310]|uniref:hypothetical protein n=1 Tax=Streptomyces sp. NBC_01310 TaxID=2903820 RepID=UPI0035B5F702|nr:hypothetical protein OG756_29755 [Streptomyces sp. NBC_01310]
MSGDNNTYFGNVVNMHDGTGNTGMVIHGGAPVGSTPSDPALEEAVRELLALLRELRAQVPRAAAQRIDESLPAITADPAVSSVERYNALTAVAGIAATVGAIGQPVLDAVRTLLALVGG